jgi:D-alanyl-D-alanine carboxypeptidase
VPDLDAVLDELVGRQFADGRTAGLAIVATDRDGVLLEHYHGMADRAAGVPVDAGTVFQIGSITKVATAILAVQQWETGRLDLHTPVRSYLPWLPERPYGVVTAHQLMSHTAGLASGSDVSPPSPYMAFVEHSEPGDFHYSNATFQVMGMVVSAVADRPYPSLLAENLMRPLRMASSFPAITSAARRTMAVGYIGSHDDRPFAAGDGLVPAPFFEYTAGDGSMACTGPDLAAFARLFVTGGAGVLTPAGFELLTTPVADTGDGEYVCYGVFTKSSYGYPDLNHGGNMVGYDSMMCVDRDTGIGVITLTNGCGGSTQLARGVLMALRQQRRGEPVTAPEPPPQPRLPDYVGVYRGGAEAEEHAVRLQDGRLHLDGAPLVHIRDDLFALPGSPYAVRFGRQDGTVVELCHGPGHWVSPEYSGAIGRPHPPEWDAYCGQYRANKPFDPTFRIVIRNGTLLQVWPGGREVPLVPTGAPATFRPDGTLEVINFDTPAGAQMLRAVLSGCPYYRTLS